MSKQLSSFELQLIERHIRRFYHPLDCYEIVLDNDNQGEEESRFCDQFAEFMDLGEECESFICTPKDLNDFLLFRIKELNNTVV